jgi:hypothetical protein
LRKRGQDIKREIGRDRKKEQDMCKDEGIKKKYVLWQINICSQFGCERIHKSNKEKQERK